MGAAESHTAEIGGRTVKYKRKLAGNAPSSPTVSSACPAFVAGSITDSSDHSVLMNGGDYGVVVVPLLPLPPSLPPPLLVFSVWYDAGAACEATV